MSKIYCSNCGNHIPQTSNFCFACGAAQHGSESATYRATMAPVAHATMPSSETIAAQPIAAQDKLKDIPRRRLCPEVKTVFFLSYMVKTSIILPLLVLGIFFEPLIFSALTAAYFIILFLTANIVYDNYYFELDDVGFQKEHGVIHKQQVSIPYAQIQNVNISRTLIDRMFGLSKIMIETAGSSAITPRDIVGGKSTKAEAMLPGVRLGLARQIHDTLLERASGR